MTLRKIVTSTIICSILILSLTACGKTYGEQSIYEDVKNGTYTYATDPNVHTSTNAIDTSNMTMAEASEQLHWVISNTPVTETAPEIQNLTKKVKTIDCKVYVGYAVSDTTIRYAFTGLDKDNNKALVYVIQDTYTDSITVIDGDYNDVNSLFN